VSVGLNSLTNYTAKALHKVSWEV